jgi:serine/threonine protein kinase
LKPENVIINQLADSQDTFSLKLVDFGFANVAEGGMQTPLGTLGYRVCD